jgi:hypothetical protein
LVKFTLQRCVSFHCSSCKNSCTTSPHLVHVRDRRDVSGRVSPQSLHIFSLLSLLLLLLQRHSPTSLHVSQGNPSQRKQWG